MFRRAAKTMASPVDTASNRDGEMWWLLVTKTSEDIDNKGARNLIHFFPSAFYPYFLKGYHPFLQSNSVVNLINALNKSPRFIAYP